MKSTSVAFEISFEFLHQNLFEFAESGESDELVDKSMIFLVDKN